MIIVADERIPGLDVLLSQSHDLRLMPGHSINTKDLRDADALIVRSVTTVDQAFLEDTKVKFVGSASAGTDHMDVVELSASGIVVAHAPGCNAPAVCDYIMTALFEISTRLQVDPFDLTIGIVGVGNVGGRLAKRLSGLGIKTLLNDPPVEALLGPEDPNPYVTLHEVLTGADVVTLHVPLSGGGPFPTRGLIGPSEFDVLRSGAWVFNASRGFVVDEALLLDAIETGSVTAAAVDTWQDEPQPNCDLVRSVSIATPHIGAYAIESKHRATQMVVDAFSTWAGDQSTAPTSSGKRPLPLAVPPPDLDDTEFCVSLIRQAYDIQRDHLRMQAMCSFSGDDQASFFRELRDNYRFRSEFASFAAPAKNLDARQKRLISGLGMRLVDS